MVLPLRDENPTRTAPVVTVAIIVACLAVYAFVQPHGDDAAFLYSHAAIPCEVVHDRPLTVLEAPTNVAQADGGPFACDRGPAARPLFGHKNVLLAVLVSMFLHASWWHVLGNLLFLWIFGNNVEERLGSIGYGAFYLVGGIVAMAADVIAGPGSTVPVLGASGAIAAVMGAYLVWFPRARVLSVVPPIFFLPFYLPAYLVLGGWFVLQFFTNPNSGVAWVAHVGGFAFGVLVALAYKGRRGAQNHPHHPRLAQHHPFDRGDAPPPWPGGFRPSG